jgi:hypothetical protein
MSSNVIIELGSTKSSFVNSCYTLLSDHLVREIALTGGRNIAGPPEMEHYRLLSLNAELATSFRLWDTCNMSRGDVLQVSDNIYWLNNEFSILKECRI